MKTIPRGKSRRKNRSLSRLDARFILPGSVSPASLPFKDSVLQRLATILGKHTSLDVSSKAYELVRSACVVLSILNEKTGGQRWVWGEGYPESLALRVADIVALALIENPDLKFHEVWPRVQEAICDGEKIRAEAFELPQGQTKDPGK